MQDAVDVGCIIERQVGLEAQHRHHAQFDRLGDLAEAMGIDMKVTGLLYFEKLHESMCDGICSADARRMSVDELKSELAKG